MASAPSIMQSGEVVDHGNGVYNTSVSIKMHPGQDGGYVDLKPETITQMVGCDPDKVGDCAAALSLDHMTITGSNVPVDSHLVLSSTDGTPLNAHCANHVHHDGSVTGVHANLRHGNVKNGLDIKIPLQPHAYLQGGTRSENMRKAVNRQKNWKNHLGKGKETLIAESTHTVKTGVDASGATHTRILVKEHTSPVGLLVKLNPQSAHPIMSIYGDKNVTKVGEHIVMDKDHVHALAGTLADTLAPLTPISRGGLRLQLKPMTHAVDHLTEPLTAQLDINLHRSPINTLMEEQETAGPVTSDHIVLGDPNQPQKPVAELRKEEHEAIWKASLGGKAPVGITETLAPATVQTAIEEPNTVAAAADENP